MIHRLRPGKPQDNGGHERMRRDISELEPVAGALSPRSAARLRPLADDSVNDFPMTSPSPAMSTMPATTTSDDHVDAPQGADRHNLENGSR